MKPYYAGGKSAKNIVDSLVDTTAHTAQAEGYKKAGAYVTVDGAFNINSTSVTAWEMLLHGLKTRKLPFIDDTLGTSGTVDDGSAVLISRFRRAASESEGASPDSVDAWKGIRKLTDSQINYLAEQMVRQVKLRGPFLNMSDFINRRLDTTDLGVCSALQAAIDWDEYNESYSGSIDASSTTANSINNIYKQAGMMITTPTATYPNVKAARGSRFAGVPGYVMASDLLQGLGNVITPRCDTFTVRAYGEAKNAKGEVVAKAWCEAVVHRTPDYVDSTNDPWDVASDDFGNDLAGLSNLNRQLGRRMRVVSFRWLKEDEV